MPPSPAPRAPTRPTAQCAARHPPYHAQTSPGSRRPSRTSQRRRRSPHGAAPGTLPAAMKARQVKSGTLPDPAVPRTGAHTEPTRGSTRETTAAPPASSARAPTQPPRSARPGQAPRCLTPPPAPAAPARAARSPHVPAIRRPRSTQYTRRARAPARQAPRLKRCRATPDAPIKSRPSARRQTARYPAVTGWR